MKAKLLRFHSRKFIGKAVWKQEKEWRLLQKLRSRQNSRLFDLKKTPFPTNNINQRKNFKHFIIYILDQIPARKPRNSNKNDKNFIIEYFKRFRGKV